MRSVVVAGHVCVDFIPQLPAAATTRPGELLEVGPLAVHAGGCVANTGGDLAELGAAVDVVGDVGDDELGTVVVALLRARGTRTDQIRLLGDRSTSYSLVFEPGGQDRSFWHHVGANAEFDGSAVDLSGADLLHVGYPSLLPALIADGGEPLVALFERARAAGVTTSLDLAVIDPASPAAREDWPALLRRVLPLVDVLSPSVDDVRTALGVDVSDLRRHRAHAARPRTRDACCSPPAAAGLQLSTAKEEHFILPPAGEVRTTLGAGDAATAGLLYGLLEGLEPRATLELAARTAAARVSGAPLTTALPPRSPRR